MFVLQVELGFDGYVEILAPERLPGLYVFSPPVTANRTIQWLPLLRPAGRSYKEMEDAGFFLVLHKVEVRYHRVCSPNPLQLTRSSNVWDGSTVPGNESRRT